MDLIEAIKERRTVRSFKSDPIPQAVLDDIFEAGMWAPSHGNSQPWEFVVVGAQSRGKLLGLLRTKAEELLASPDLPEPKRKAIESLKEDFGGAPYMVAVLSQPGEKPLDAVENPASAAAAVQNMCLAAWSRGVGSVWLSVGAAPPSRPILGVPEGAQVVALLAMGYPEELPPAPPREDYKTRLREVP